MLKKNTIYINLILMGIFSLFGSCKTTTELSTVKELDIEKYMGIWYEIARLPNSFEENMKCVTAIYSIKDNGKIEVLNKGYNTEKKSFNTAKGIAKMPDSNLPGQLKVSFFWPFFGDYYIISLDKDYKYALVGDPSRKYLWILAREPKLDTDSYNKLIQIAKDKGFAVEEIYNTPHDCK